VVSAASHEGLLNLRKRRLASTATSAATAVALRVVSPLLYQLSYLAVFTHPLQFCGRSKDREL
jgi:hypothetical protein